MILSQEKKVRTENFRFSGRNQTLPRLITDHLGSTRVVLNESGNIEATSDYYPFGLEARGTSSVNEPKEGFNSKQFDQESGFNYFGARYYNPQIARFSTVDRYSSKFPSLSGYQYAAGNPILIVDYNGDEIVISHDGEDIEYKKGKLYWKGTDKAYDGKAKRDGKGFFGKIAKAVLGEYKGFVGDSYSALKNIESGGESGGKLVGDLVDSKEVTTIKESKNGANGFAEETGTAYWDPNAAGYTIDDANRISSTPGFVGLAHELGHGMDRINPPYGKENWFSNVAGDVRVTEQEAGRWENAVRKEHGLPRRAYYSFQITPDGKINKWGPLE